MKDEILSELWKIKDEIAKKYDYNVYKLAYALMEKEKKEKRKIIKLNIHQNK